MKSHRRLILRTTGLVSLLAAGPCLAQTWDGGGVAGGAVTWTSATNWNPDGVPVNTGAANIIMAGTIDLNPDMDAAWNINSLTFNNTAGNFNLGSTGAFTLTVGNITNSDTQLQTISHAVSPKFGSIWDTGTGGVTILGAITGTAGFIKQGGTSTLTFGGTAANTYSGITTINAGTLLLQKTGVNAITGTLVVGDSTGTDTLTLGASNQIADTAGVSFGGGALFNVAGQTEIIGALTVGAGATVDIGAGTLTAASLNLNSATIIGTGVGSLRTSGNVQTTGTSGSLISVPSFNLGGVSRTFTVPNSAAAVDLDISSAISNGSIVKDSAGTLRLSAANSYTSLSLNAGTVLFGDSNAAGSSTMFVTGTSTIGSDAAGVSLPNLVQFSAVTVGVTGANTLALNGPSVLAGDPTIDVTGTSTLNLGGVVSGFGRSITKTGTGNLNFTGSSSNTFNGTSALNEGAMTLAKNGTAIALAGNLTVGDGIGTDVLSIPFPSDQVADTSQISVNSSGQMTVGSGSETMARLNVFGGEVILDPLATVTVTGGMIMSAGKITDGTLGLASNLSTQANAVSALITSDVDLSGAIRTLLVADNASNPVDLDITGEVADGGILKSGTGTLRLTAANIFSGGLNVTGGEVVLGSDTSAGAGLLTLNGAAVRSAGGQRVFQNSLATFGQCTFGGADDMFFVGTGTLGANGVLSFTNTGVTYFVGTLAGNGPDAGFIRSTTGNGKVSFNNPVAHTYTGATDIRHGTLELGSTAPNGGVPAALIVGDGTGAANSDIVRLMRIDQIANNSAVTVNGGASGSALLDLNGFTDTIGSLTLTGGKVTTGAAVLVLSSDVTVTSSSTVSSITGTLNMGGGDRIFSVDNGSASPDLDLNGVIVNGTLRKNGLGTLALSGAAGTSDISAVLNAGQLDGNFTVRHGRSFTQDGGNYDDTLTNAGTFTFNGGNFTGTLVNTGSFIVNGAFSGAAGVSNTGSITVGVTGTLSSSAAGLTNNGSIQLQGGTLGGSGPLVNNSLLTGYGTIAGSGGFTNSATFTQDGGNIILSNTGTNKNTGNLTLASGRQFQLSAGLENAGTLDLNSGVISGAATLLNSSGGSITGRGTISSAFSNTGGFLSNTGGTLNLTSSFANSGTIALDGLTAALNGGTVTNNGTIEGHGVIGSNVTNSQTIEASGGTLTLGGTITNTGLLAAGQGAKLLISGTMPVNAGTVSLTGGTFDTAGDALNSTGQITGYGILRTGGLTNNGTLTLTGGLSTVNGNVTNAAGKTVHVAHNPAVFTGNFTNNGVFKNTETTVTFTGTYTENGTFVSDPADNYFADIIIGPTGKLTGGLGDRFYVLRDFINNSTQSADWTTHDSGLIFEGGPAHNFFLAGTDTGPNASGYTSNFAWGFIRFAAGQSITLMDGNATPGAAVYTRALVIDGGVPQISNITGNGFNIYYDPSDTRNAFLNGLTYPLTGGGSIRPIGAQIFITGSTFQVDGTLKIDVLGVPNALHNIEASEDLATFTVIGTATPGISGIFSYIDTDADVLRRRYYRIVKP